MSHTVSEIEKRTIRKVAWRLLPLIVIIYLVAYIDRTNVGFAAAGGMSKALGLTGAIWENCASWSGSRRHWLN